MKEAILAKISDLLQKEIETEAECVYFLAQIRKYIEQQQIPQYFNLRMCANWALHSQLDNNRSVQFFLTELNDFLRDSEERNDYFIDEHQALKNKLSFVTGLREELSNFLYSVGIDFSVCTDNNRFRNLLRIFGNVIEDTPLICKTNVPLSHLTKVSFSRRSLGLPDHFKPFGLIWEISLDSKKVLYIKSDIIVQVMPNNSEIETQTFSFVTNDRI